MHIAFHGANGTVTGSRTLVTTSTGSLLVDCGLYQGIKSLRERNWARPDFDVDGLEGVVLTHAHLDHAGWLPRLVRLGFHRPIHCTPATADYAAVLLRDAAWLQEEEARWHQRHGTSRHDAPEPLYGVDDAERALALLRPTDDGATVAGATVTFRPAGHIPGASWVRVQADGTDVVFSGDLGRSDDPLLPAPEPLDGADWLVLESTYGDRSHPAVDLGPALVDVVRRTVARGGTVVIPVFAVGRAQLLLHLLAQAGQTLPPVPIFLDSPMAIEATELLDRHAGSTRLNRAQHAALRRIARCTRTVEESKAIAAHTGPAVILAGSGMATGGRVLHHLRRLLPHAEHTVLLVGFQAIGTRGRALLDGVEELKLLGAYVPVAAQVERLAGTSAHADRDGLIGWAGAARRRPNTTFLVHGEPGASDGLRRALRDRLGWRTVVPETGDHAELAPRDAWDSARP